MPIPICSICSASIAAKWPGGATTKQPYWKRPLTLIKNWLCMLRYLLRAIKIVRRDWWAKCTTLYTRWYFRANGVLLGRDMLSNGVPELEMSLSGSFTAGEDLQLQNGQHYNMIGRQQKCYFMIGKGGSLTIGDHVGLSGVAI